MIVYQSKGETSGMIAFRCGGAELATLSCIRPSYEEPNMPMFPSHHGCAASHSVMSYPSIAADGSLDSLQFPNEAPVPRMSAAASMYPCRITLFAVGRPAGGEACTRFGG